MKMKSVPIKLKGTGKIPQHAAGSTTTFLAYADLKQNDIMVQPRKYIRVPIGFSAKLPSNWLALAFVDEKFAMTKNMRLVSSLIESDDDTEWAVYLYNDSGSTQIIEHGEKIARMIFIKAKECKILPFLDKGERDFGIAGNPEEA